jgi:hypothetical protein
MIWVRGLQRTFSFLAPDDSDHMLARGDHFVGLKHDLPAGRLGSLRAGQEA